MRCSNKLPLESLFKKKKRNPSVSQQKGPKGIHLLRNTGKKRRTAKTGEMKRRTVGRERGTRNHLGLRGRRRRTSPKRIQKR